MFTALYFLVLYLNAGPHSDPDPPPRVLRDHSARSFLLARVYTERF